MKKIIQAFRHIKVSVKLIGSFMILMLGLAGLIAYNYSRLQILGSWISRKNASSPEESQRIHGRDASNRCGNRSFGYRDSHTTATEEMSAQAEEVTISA